MIGQTKRERNSALNDLSDGMRLLLGLDSSRPDFIRALLDNLDEDGHGPAARNDASRRTRGSSKLRLVRVEKL